MMLNVSNIQHFSVGDGPGIRTTVFLKGCHLHCPWCHNPETISREPQELIFQATGTRVLYGREMTVEEVLGEVMEDVDFYRASGGGVTVSGGEPLLQSEGISALLCCLKAHGLHTLVDTAGCVGWDCFERVLPLTDVFYFDVKSGRAEDYLHVIGGDGERAFKNLSRLIECGACVHARIPLIPDFNTSGDACAEICKRLLAAGVTQVDLLPFHRLGSSKYVALGIEYPYRDISPAPAAQIEAIAEFYGNYFTVRTEK